MTTIRVDHWDEKGYLKQLAELCHRQMTDTGDYPVPQNQAGVTILDDHTSQGHSDSLMRTGNQIYPHVWKSMTYHSIHNHPLSYMQLGQDLLSLI